MAVLDPNTAAAPPVPPAPAPPDAAMGDEKARIDTLEQRVSDLEQIVAEMAAEDMTVDEVMPDPALMGQA